MQSQILRFLSLNREVLHQGRVGLLCNQTSFDTLQQAYLFEILGKRGVLSTLFLPEHGLFAELQDQVPLEETHVYGSLGLKARIVSLYGNGEHTLAVSPEELRRLDALVVDIQDVGSRYYTFATTVSYIFDVLTEHRIPLEVFVLDRPNPAGRGVEGTVLPESHASFVGRPGLIHRHGLTMGELALLYRDQTGGSFPLHIVPLDLPLRNSLPEDVDLSLLRVDGNGTGESKRQEGGAMEPPYQNQDLPWIIPPSPNMPGSVTPQLYSGQCLLEGTNLSEGRGTTRPFEIFGAPYMTWPEFEERNESPHRVNGAVLRPLRFIPTFHKHSQEICTGYQIHLTGEPYHSLAHTLKILRMLREKHGAFAWREGPYEFRSDRPAIELLTGDPLLMDYLEGRTDFASVKDLFAEEESRWIAASEAYRIYEAPLFRVES